ncbi:MAG TPA: hypothetical protein VGD56_07815 [Gemmatirosa sp.]
MLPVRWFCRRVGATAGALVLASAAATAHADAQIAGVLTRPRVTRPAGDSAVGPDSTVHVGRTAAKVPAEERQRLDIQAWVDSAASALATAPPTTIPAPGTGSIFNAPAVPDSLRPPPAPSPRARARRPQRARTARTSTRSG